MSKNILFIMYDQLRYDYLSYAGHKTLQTPNFDRLAAKGLNFTNTYVHACRSCVTCSSQSIIVTTIM